MSPLFFKDANVLSSSRACFYKMKDVILHVDHTMTFCIVQKPLLGHNFFICWITLPFQELQSAAI